MDAAVRVKNQWLFEGVDGRTAAELRGRDKLLEVIGLDEIEFDVLLNPANPSPAAPRADTYVALGDAGWAGNTRGDMRPLEGLDFQPFNAFGQDGVELRGFPRFGGPLSTLCMLSRADLERLARAALQALGIEAVSFGTMPDGKPEGGFLEVGDCTLGDDTYPWESDVEFMQGSNGKVYALVESSADALPTLDENGHVIDSEEPAAGDQCPHCGGFDRGAADFIKDHGKCRDCHARWQSGEPDEDEAESVVHCPVCQSRNVSVIEVSCMVHRRPHQGRWPLDNDGFDWCSAGTHRDGSTDNEVVECDDCHHRGDLTSFNFQAA